MEQRIVSHIALDTQLLGMCVAGVFGFRVSALEPLVCTREYECIAVKRGITIDS